MASLQTIKNCLESMGSARDILRKFDETQPAIIRWNTKRHLSLLSKASDEERKKINQYTNTQRELITKLLHLDNITQICLILADAIAKMKIATLQGYEKDLQRLIWKFIYQDDLKLKETVLDSAELLTGITRLKSNQTRYSSYVRKLGYKPDSGSKELDKLKSEHKQRHEYLLMLSKMFVEAANEWVGKLGKRNK